MQRLRQAKRAEAARHAKSEQIIHDADAATEVPLEATTVAQKRRAELRAEKNRDALAAYGVDLAKEAEVRKVGGSALLTCSAPRISSKLMRWRESRS